MTTTPANINRIFRAGFVRRWHTNPDLAHTGDRLDGHHARVARLMLALWPDTSAAALAYALTHDDGESVVGDMPQPAKDGDSSAERKAKAEIWPELHMPVTATEIRRIHYCDRLDAFMWMQHHAPHCSDMPEWVHAASYLTRLGEELF